MKIPGTPRRMDSELEGILDGFKKMTDGFSVTAEQFNSAFTEAFGLDNDDIQSKPKIPGDYTIGLNTIYSVENKNEPQAQARLTPASCSCCGGRIGKDNYCEYCGTRYW